jgi:hypothetical protein
VQLAIWIVVALSGAALALVVFQSLSLRRAQRRNSLLVMTPRRTLEEVAAPQVLDVGETGRHEIQPVPATSIEPEQPAARSGAVAPGRAVPVFPRARVRPRTDDPRQLLPIIGVIFAVIGALGTWVNLAHDWDAKRVVLRPVPPATSVPVISTTSTSTTTTTQPPRSAPTNTTTRPRHRAKKFVGLTGDTVPEMGAASSSNWSPNPFTLGQYVVDGYTTNCCVDSNVQGGPGRQISFDGLGLSGDEVIFGLLNGQIGSGPVKVQFDTRPARLFQVTTGHPQAVLIPRDVATLTVDFVGGGDTDDRCWISRTKSDLGVIARRAEAGSYEPMRLDGVDARGVVRSEVHRGNGPLSR